MAVSWLMVDLKTGDRGKQKQDGRPVHTHPILLISSFEMSFFSSSLVLCSVLLLYCSFFLFNFTSLEVDETEIKAQVHNTTNIHLDRTCDAS